MRAKNFDLHVYRTREGMWRVRVAVGRAAPHRTHEWESVRAAVAEALFIAAEQKP